MKRYTSPLREEPLADGILRVGEMAYAAHTVEGSVASVDDRTGDVYVKNSGGTYDHYRVSTELTRAERRQVSMKCRMEDPLAWRKYIRHPEKLPLDEGISLHYQINGQCDDPFKQTPQYQSILYSLGDDVLLAAFKNDSRWWYPERTGTDLFIVAAALLQLDPRNREVIETLVSMITLNRSLKEWGSDQAVDLLIANGHRTTALDVLVGNITRNDDRHLSSVTKLISLDEKDKAIAALAAAIKNTGRFSNLVDELIKLGGKDEAVAALVAAACDPRAMMPEKLWVVSQLDSISCTDEAVAIFMNIISSGLANPLELAEHLISDSDTVQAGVTQAINEICQDPSQAVEIRLQARMVSYHWLAIRYNGTDGFTTDPILTLRDIAVDPGIAFDERLLAFKILLESNNPLLSWAVFGIIKERAAAAGHEQLRTTLQEVVNNVDLGSRQRTNATLMLQSMDAQ